MEDGLQGDTKLAKTQKKYALSYRSELPKLNKELECASEKIIVIGYYVLELLEDSNFLTLILVG